MRTGYPGVTAIVPDKYDSAQSFTTLITRPNQRKIRSDFLCCYINSEGGQRFFTQSQIGGAQKNVNSGTLSGMPKPVPPLPEQRAIVEALSDVDGLLGGLDRLIAKKRDLKQAAMQQLLTALTAAAASNCQPTRALRVSAMPRESVLPPLRLSDPRPLPAPRSLLPHVHRVPL